jgi:toxin ParE1/3/4
MTSNNGDLRGSGHPPESDMYKLRISPDAKADLDSIWDYIAEDNPAEATDFVLKILDRCELLTEQPYMGPARDLIREGLRIHPVDDYVVLYRIIDDIVDIVHVFHGKRDYQGIFGS